MEELFRYSIEGGSLGVSLFFAYILFRKFIKKQVVEPIEELQADTKEIKKGFVTFTERIIGFMFRVIKSNDEMKDHLTNNVSDMNNLFRDLAQQVSGAVGDSSEAIKRLNVLEQTADKILKIATVVHQRNDRLESEVKRINAEMIMIKTKVGKN